MPLVPDTWVDEWFQKDNFIYKNYAYLYQNPLWHKRIPGGASLCPYFWMAMFSFLFFKPVFVPAMRVVGFMFSKLDEHGLSSEKGKKVVGLLFLVMLTLIAVLGIGFIIQVVYKACMGAGDVGEWGFWMLAVGIPLAVGVGVYNQEHKYDPQRCKAEIYLFFWLLIVGISGLVLIPEECVALANGIWSTITLVVGTACSWIWIALKYTVWGIWMAVKWVALMVLSLLCAVVLGIPIILYIMGVYALFIAIGRFTLWLERRREDKLRATLLTEDQWKRAFFYGVRDNEMWYEDIKFGLFAMNDCGEEPDRRMAFISQFNIMRKYFTSDLILSFIQDEVTVPEALLSINRLQFDQKIKNHIFYTMWEEVDFENFEEINTAIRSVERTIKERFPQTSSVTTWRNAWSGFDFSTLINRYYDQSVAKQQGTAKKEEKKAKIASKMDIYCQKTTTFLSKFTKPIRKLFVFIFGGGWNVVCKIFKNVAIFVGYMWMVIVARKQKACPYKHFQEKLVEESVQEPANG